MTTDIPYAASATASLASPSEINNSGRIRTRRQLQERFIPTSNDNREIIIDDNVSSDDDDDESDIEVRVVRIGRKTDPNERGATVSLPLRTARAAPARTRATNIDSPHILLGQNNRAHRKKSKSESKNVGDTNHDREDHDDFDDVVSFIPDDFDDQDVPSNSSNQNQDPTWFKIDDDVHVQQLEQDNVTLCKTASRTFEIDEVTVIEPSEKLQHQNYSTDTVFQTITRRQGIQRRLRVQNSSNIQSDVQPSKIHNSFMTINNIISVNENGDDSEDDVEIVIEDGRSATDVVPAESKSPKSILHRILDIFPDVSHEFIEELLGSKTAESDEETIRVIVAELIANPNYPKSKTNKVQQSSSMDSFSDHNGMKKNYDFMSTTSFDPSDLYIELAFRQLLQDFPFLSHTGAKKIFHHNEWKHHYAICHDNIFRTIVYLQPKQRKQPSKVSTSATTSTEKQTSTELSHDVEYNRALSALGGQPLDHQQVHALEQLVSSLNSDIIPEYNATTSVAAAPTDTSLIGGRKNKNRRSKRVHYGISSAGSIVLKRPRRTSLTDFTDPLSSGITAIPTGFTRSSEKIIMDPILCEEIKYVQTKISDWMTSRKRKIDRSMKQISAQRSGTAVECACCYDSYHWDDIISCQNQQLKSNMKPDSNDVIDISDTSINSNTLKTLYAISPINDSNCSDLLEQHLFCGDCVTRMIENLVFSQGNLGYDSRTKELALELKCCHPSGCSSGFYRSDLERVVVPSSLLIKYDEIQFQLSIQKAGLKSRLHSCPSCSMQCEIPMTQNIFLCPVCHFESCRWCGEASHIPLRCEEASKDKKETSGRTKVEEAITAAAVRQCPNCSRNFIKSDGCNKVRCGCGIYVCYICRQEITNGYNHFCQKPHCNHKVNCNLCALHTTNEQDIEIQNMRNAAIRASHLIQQITPDVQIDIDKILPS